MKQENKGRFLVGTYFSCHPFVFSVLMLNYIKLVKWNYKNDKKVSLLNVLYSELCTKYVCVCVCVCVCVEGVNFDPPERLLVWGQPIIFSNRYYDSP